MPGQIQGGPEGLIPAAGPYILTPSKFRITKFYGLMSFYQTLDLSMDAIIMISYLNFVIEALIMYTVYVLIPTEKAFCDKFTCSSVTNHRRCQVHALLALLGG